MLAQQHWGKDIRLDDLASWSSSGNSLEALAFLAKDTLLVVDDFNPTGSAADVARFQRDADRVLRAQGNRSARRRMRPDTTLRPPKPPRGLIVATGEDVPRGHSLRARNLILDVPKDRTDWAAMTRCQRDAEAGRYAEALVGFVGFWAKERARNLGAFRADVDRLRAQTDRLVGHKRTAAAVAELGAALLAFGRFAGATAALTADEPRALSDRCWRALRLVALAQAGHQRQSEPPTQFRTYLGAAISAGDAHVATTDGGAPQNPGAWGWRCATVGTGHYERDEWRPQGRRIGWLDGDALYLEPDGALAAAQDLARRTGDNIPVTAAVLRRRLHDAKLLLAVDKARETLTVRRTVEGGQKNVLAVSARDFLSLDENLPDKPDNDGDGRASAPGDGGKPDTVVGSVSGTPEEPDSENPSERAGYWANVGFVGSCEGKRDGTNRNHPGGGDPMSGSADRTRHRPDIGVARPDSGDGDALPPSPNGHAEAASGAPVRRRDDPREHPRYAERLAEARAMTDDELGAMGDDVTWMTQNTPGVEDLAIEEAVYAKVYRERWVARNAATGVPA
jgi:hypothetical protein